MGHMAQTSHQSIKQLYINVISVGSRERVRILVDPRAHSLLAPGVINRSSQSFHSTHVRHISGKWHYPKSVNQFILNSELI